MPNPYFRFQQFTVFHDRCAMKVGTDGVLLGAWVQVHRVQRILDIGTGTGLIALMLAQRCEAIIDGLDIDEHACIQARENVARSPWSQRIRIVHTSMQHWQEQPPGSYDLIVSNPPYFSMSLPAQTTTRTWARHNDSLPPRELLSAARCHLSTQGRLAVIYPTSQATAFLQMASSCGFFCRRILQVKPKADKPTHRILLELSTQPHHDHPCEHNELVIEQAGRHTYTPEYAALTRDFYLRFRHDS